jgi:hypothetical protein
VLPLCVQVARMQWATMTYRPNLMNKYAIKRRLQLRHL